MAMEQISKPRKEGSRLDPITVNQANFDHRPPADALVYHGVFDLDVVLLFCRTRKKANGGTKRNLLSK